MAKRSINDLEITGVEVCRLFGRTREWLHGLVTKGDIQQSNGKYRLADACRGYVESLKDSGKRAAKGATASQAKTREIERKMARDDHAIIELDEALSTIDEVIGSLRSDFSAFGASVTRDMALKSVIQEKTDALFQRAATNYAKKAAALQSSGTAADPEEAPAS